MTLRDFLFLPDNARLADFGLLLLRCVTGAFLIFQSHDNVLSTERMVEFEKFLTQFGFVYPELMAPLSVYAQFVAGIAFILGFCTRWAASSPLSISPSPSGWSIGTTRFRASGRRRS